jgi:peptidoglycan lytic transglycosylase D
MMNLLSRSLYSCCAFLAVLACVGCETSESRRASVDPPPQATAPTIAEAPKAPAAPAASPQTAAPPADPVPATVAAAEKEYQTGQAEYQAGHLETAKQHFDRAFNILTTGPVSVKSDARLQAEFEKVVEGVNQLELQALKQGDGFTEQQAVAAPIDEANDVTFPVDPNLRAQAAANLANTKSDLPLVMNDYVAGYINFYSTRGRGTLERALTRAGRYRSMIERVLREEGVPQDLIYLAQAESGFQPLALSRAGARGMWQFMAGRASSYGLERNHWVDERQDPEKATRAAARHLKDLFNQFGDWYLVMAAYNSGPGNVQNAVKRTGYADFWELYKRNVLPGETKNYVPIIVAVTIMAKNPQQYGLTEVMPEQPPVVDRIVVHYPVDLRLVAECVDAPTETLQELNPSLLRLTTPKDSDFELVLPVGTKERYLAAIAAIPEDKRVLWRYHKVQAGETLTSIAKKYKTTAAQISDVNGLDAEDVQPDAKLIIPMVPGRSSETSDTVYAKHPVRYKVRRGDTILSVADDYGVPPEKLRSWNHIKGNDLRRGRTLYIYRPVRAGEAASTPRSHRKSKSRKGLHSTTKKSSKTHKASGTSGTAAASAAR